MQAGNEQKKIDRQWFLGQLTLRKLSMRRVSEQMGLDASAMSLILSGNRGVSPDECRALGDVLLQPATEIMRRLGVPIHDDIRRIPIGGRINGASEVILYKQADGYVGGPADLPHDAIALQLRTIGTPLHQFDGWIAYVASNQGQPERGLGQLSVAATADHHLYLATIERGYRPDTYNLAFNLGGQAHTDENLTLAYASSVLWLKPR